MTVAEPPMLPFLRRFVAGRTAEEALEAVKRLNGDGLKATLDLLGEETRSQTQAAAAASEISELFHRISREGVDSNVSVKLTQLGLALGAQQGFLGEPSAEENLRRVLDAAAQHGNFVRIDMEGSAYTQRTLDLFHGLFTSRRNVGVVIQAALRRSAGDVERLLGVNARVRLCKGAYKEPPELAFQDMNEVNRSYDALALRLLERGNTPAIATHDDARIANVLEAASRLKVPRKGFELQMLYGVRRSRAVELARQGYNVRVYVPFGTHWFPYYYRRIRERKENLLFALRSILGD